MFWLTVPSALLAVAFPCQRLLDALLLARLQIECVPLDFLNDVLLQDFALEAFERTLQAFAIVNLNFSQWNLPPAPKGERRFKVTASDALSPRRSHRLKASPYFARAGWRTLLRSKRWLSPRIIDVRQLTARWSASAGPGVRQLRNIDGLLVVRKSHRYWIQRQVTTE